MRLWTRRDVLKASAASLAAACVPQSAGPARPTLAAATAARRARERLRLDSGWKFAYGHAADPDRDFGFGRGRMFAKAGDLFAPSAPDFDDRAWRPVELPHDWAVALPFRENVEELIEFGSKPLGRAYPDTSIGWYRRMLDIPAADAGRRLTLSFDGVFRDAVVALNGHLLGRNESGYAPFHFDISDVATPGQPNVLVVRVDATGREGWFYEGAGIYRHVWLGKSAPVHVAHEGVFVTSALGKAGATLTIATSVDNDGDAASACRVHHAVLDASGRTIAATPAARPLELPARARAETTATLNVAAPTLWSPDTPALYTLVTTLLPADGHDDAPVDRIDTSFGIRTVHFDAARGFFLNGEHLLLQGTCNHQDHAGVGVALPDRLHAYRIERLKAMGSNAYRASHNPPSPALLDACDRLCMLVLDESRLFSSGDEGLGQLERLIRRDRNHPCVFAWSVANEEWADQDNDVGARIASQLVHLAHTLDPSRPVTAAMDGGWGAGISHVVDVQGCNYERPKRPESNLTSFHERFPRMPMMGTEVASTYCTRGEYVADQQRGYVTGYDLDKPGYGATAEGWWTFFAERPWLAGGFVWTGFDYRGEPSPYRWPCISSHFGIMDTCGFAKDNFYYYQAWWGRAPVLHLFPHWHWPGREGQTVDVWVHANLARVELFLNGKSLGAKPVEPRRHLAWQVPYAPGTLEARGYDASGKLALTATRVTPGAPARLVASADRATLAADGQDVAVVSVSVVDADGHELPTASHELRFAVTGAGRLLGVGNGAPSSHEADTGPTRKLFNGLASAIVQAARAPGDIRVEVTAPGLTTASVALRSA